MSKKIIVLLIFLASTAVLGCTNQSEENEGLGTVDLSSDDNYVVFSYFKNNVSSLYLLNLIDNKVLSLASSSKEESYVFPKFSPNGNEIAFVVFPSGKKTSNIFLMDKNGGNKKQLTFGDQIITEVEFSNDGSKLYYCMAKEYKSYSPIGIAAAHNMDIYCFDLKSKASKKITNLEAYNINDVSEINNAYLMVDIQRSAGGNMCILPLDNPDSLSVITPGNNPRGDFSLYDDPKFSEKFGKIVFTAPYELYIMDFKRKEAEKIFRSYSHIYNINIFYTQEKVLFTLHGENVLRIIDFNGKLNKEISIIVP